MLFRRLSHEAYRTFREKQIRLFGNILECFGIGADCARVGLFTNISLMAMIVRRAIPETMPLFVPEAADETVAFQIKAIVDFLEPLKKKTSADDGMHRIDLSGLYALMPHIRIVFEQNKYKL